MKESAPLILDLLTYIEQVEKLKTKPAFTVPTEHFAAYRHELKGLPALQFNLQAEGEDIWLRVPRLHEIPPPGLDERLSAWFRKGDVNPAEAKAIVDEIEAILADSNLAGRSVGVVTLLGTAQAASIQELVSNRISPVDIVSRKIAVGPPPVFQGKERDIMLVSMVLGPGDRAAQNVPFQEQRFNVALSRARDRMYLFRSVEQTAFAEDTLNGKLIRHFKKPFMQDVGSTRVLRERCESAFELDVFDELVTRGFRIEPQVKCGAYRIDFVVEGREGRRLAIECDGDRFHGPGQWADDMARQRVLERAGWTFWRCFASSFNRRRREVINDLLQTLQGLGIEPLGSEFVDTTVWVQSREVDPYAVADQPATPHAYQSSPPDQAPNSYRKAEVGTQPQADAAVNAAENGRLFDFREPSDEDVRSAIYSAVPASGQMDVDSLVRTTASHLGFATVGPSLKRQINRILGGETGAGKLQRDADWQIRRSIL